MSKKVYKNVQTKKQGELLSLHIYKNNMDVLNFLYINNFYIKLFLKALKGEQ